MKKKLLKELEKFVEREIQRHEEFYEGEFRYMCCLKEKGVISNYTWKDIESGEKIPNVPVLYFLVQSTNRGRKHIVSLSQNPRTGKFAIWCGDKELKERFGISDYCNFWKNNRKCKHTAWVLYFLREALRIPRDSWKEDVEKFIDILSQQKPTATTTSSRTEEVEKILATSLPTLIVGPTGSGKTHTVLKVLLQKQKAGELEFCVINFTSGMEDTDLLAKFVPTSDGKWEVRDGELWGAFKEAQNLPDGKRYVIVLEELTRATPKALNILVKAMDGVGKSYRLQNFVTGEEIAVPKKKLQFIGLANLGASYSGTEELDPALMRRFLICRFWDYDTATEREILLKLGLDEAEADKLQRFVQSQRDSYRRGQFPYPIDTGTFRSWVELKISSGMSWWESFEFTCLYRIVDRDTQGFPDEVQVQALKELMEDLSLE